ncbi:MAG TPA: MiaB/RimO family radical SAM methylthiotransferase [Phycisphaerales bacterium]|nr:MiaB/RimO family radical SAM methylthiotransferase [Phycisphaerales bacterium]
MPARRVYLETFGCQMNELDSELVAGQLARLGYAFTASPDEADVVLYNTCSVREQAEQKVWSRLGELALRKRHDPAVVVGVLGCMAERDGVDLIRRMPVVDVMCGPGELDKLPALLDNAVRTKESLESETARRRGSEAGSLRSARQVALQGSTSRRSATLAAAEDNLEMLDLSRAVSPVDAAGAAKRSAYVRITRGCNKFCTYCVVPFTRGAEVHRPPDHIVDECKRLADAGVVEITLLGQTVNHYRFEHGAAVTVGGVTQPQKGRSYKGGHSRDPFAGERVTTFAGLLARIHEEVPAIRRLRFVTSYPRDFGDDVLEAMRDHPRICRYLHVPAQSGSNRVLAKMNRGYTVEEYEEFLARARAHLDQPELGRPLMVSGDIIAGFPTETDEDFAATAALLRRVRYKNCFIFKYSPRPGTVAYDRIPDDVPESVKRRRNNELLAIQSEISDAIAREQVGREVGVFVEGVSRQQLRREGRSQGEIRRAGGAVTLTVGGREPGRGLPGSALAAAPESGPGSEGDGQCAETWPSLEESVRPRRPTREESTARTVQLSGRTDGDLIVFFEAPRERVGELTGEIVRVRVTGADRLSLHGTVEGGRIGGGRR